MGTVQLATLLSLFVCHTVLGMTTPSTNSSEDRIQQLASVSKQLARQLMLQQLYVEEKTRSEGDSGLKQVYHFLFILLHQAVIFQGQIRIFFFR